GGDATQGLDHVGADAAEVPDRRLLTDPDPAVDAGPEVLGEVAVEMPADRRTGQVEIAHGAQLGHELSSRSGEDRDEAPAGTGFAGSRVVRRRRPAVAGPAVSAGRRPERGPGRGSGADRRSRRVPAGRSGAVLGRAPWSSANPLADLLVCPVIGTPLSSGYRYTRSGWVDSKRDHRGAEQGARGR